MREQLRGSLLPDEAKPHHKPAQKFLLQTSRILISQTLGIGFVYTQLT